MGDGSHARVAGAVSSASSMGSWLVSDLPTGAPIPGEGATQRDLIPFIADLEEAGNDCRPKLRSVRELLVP